ncbi:restriction endonuclease subunit S [Peptoniphilus harei]|uniref:restriction endonuclease subunit S n=1 Tax=Peptoniphilus harei TaxID=54005 RepID=UPI002910DED6|nr:restriction endonuclease subunit S [Peptoniphilus harei]MDU6097732.1 restriction endonuclease subunit S [Peptoniphilus harei]
MKKNKNVPKIRFEEFNEEWSKEQLKKLVDIFDGTHQTPKYTKNGVKFVSVENIKSLETDKYISIDDFIKEYSSKRPQKGDVLMTRIGDIGTTNIVKTDEALGYYVTLALLKPKNIDGIYLSYSINSKSVQKDLWKRTLHIAFPKKINLGEIEKIEIKFPELEEQIMIGNYFENLDNLISLQKQKYEKFLDLKKAMLYKLFPREGEATPEIRFNEFTGDWEKRKIKDICSISNGCMNTQDAKEKGVYPFFIRSEQVMKSDTYVYDEEAILTPGEGRIGEIFHYIDGKYTAHQRVYRLFNFSEEVFPIYLLHELKNNFKKHALQNSSTATAPSIRMGTIADYEFMLPNLDEQKAIGEYFSRLDNLINLNKKKLDKLKNAKSSLLDNMFV